MEPGRVLPEAVEAAYRAARDRDPARIVDLDVRPDAGIVIAKIEGDGLSGTLRFDMRLGNMAMPRQTLALERRGAPAPGVDVTLSPDGGLAVRIGKFLWLRDAEIGDPEFDAAFVIRTADPKRLAAELAPDLRIALIAQKRLHRDALVHIEKKGARVTIEKHGVAHLPEHVTALLDIGRRLLGA